MNILELQKRALAVVSDERLELHMKRLDNIAVIHGYSNPKLDLAETQRVEEYRKRFLSPIESAGQTNVSQH